VGLSPSCASRPSPDSNVRHPLTAAPVTRVERPAGIGQPARWRSLLSARPQYHRRCCRGLVASSSAIAGVLPPLMTTHRWSLWSSPLYGAADWMTASISVQGSYLVGCHDLVTGDSGDEPGRVVVRSRYCHFCCHRPAGRRWTTRRAARPNRISSSGRHGSESFGLDQHARSVLRVPRCTALNCTRTATLRSVARFRPSRSFRGCLTGLLAGVADGCGVQLHPALSISVVSKSVSKVPSLVALLAGTGTRLLLHSR
jgi:hypothetical protein